MPLFYHGAAAVVKMDYCCFCHSVRCIILHGEKVQKWCDLLSPLSFSLFLLVVVVVCLLSLRPLLLLWFLRGVGWSLFDFFITSNASRRLLTSCGVAAP